MDLRFISIPFPKDKDSLYCDTYICVFLWESLIFLLIYESFNDTLTSHTIYS
jgi:hypothetical protein